MLLAGCGGSGSAPPPPGDLVACQPAGATKFTSICTFDRSQRGDVAILTVHLPDGGFRRFEIAKDGQGVIAADGAEKAVVTLHGDKEIEVAIGGDRYRLPATLKAKPTGTP